MPTPTKGPRLGGSPSHERRMLANLATALFEHGRITTTEARARRLRPVAERLITFAKRGDLHARRQVLTTVTDRDVVHMLFTDIAPTFASRDGGYTRITKIGPRKGDNAAMAVIELVPEEVEARPSRRRRARRAQPAARPQAEAAAAETAEAEDAEAEDSAAQDTEAEDTEAEDSAAQDTEAEDSVAEDTEAEDTATEDTAAEAEDSAAEPDDQTAESSEDDESDDDQPEDAS